MAADILVAILLAVASLVQWVEVIEPAGVNTLPPGVRVLCVAGHPANVKVCSEILCGVAGSTFKPKAQP